MVHGQNVAGFDYSTGTIYIKKQPGVIDLYHEGYHAAQYLDIGREAYIKLGSLARAEHVYGQIMKHLNLFNIAELAGAEKYITRLRGRMQ